MNNGDLVTVSLDPNNPSSNTYIVYKDLGQEVILFHPLNEKCFIVRAKEDLNKVAANIKDSTERGLDFAFKFQKYLDYNTIADLEALSLFYIVNRTLSSKQLGALSNIGGRIASTYFHNDVQAAMRYIVDNKAVLNSFNQMWFNNFKDIFNGKQPITSPKQRASIFNIAGFVLAELERNEASREK
jgi:hypothetical protein